MQQHSGGPSRGRVVMLVDNGVTGDSRVEKAAASAAAAGWDVTLLGVKGTGAADEWELEGAKVRLIPLAGKIQHPSRLRRAPLRRPLAYPPGPVAGARMQANMAWKTDLMTRRAEVATGRVTPTPAGRARLEAEWFVARALGRWAHLRNQQLRSLQASRGNPGSALVTVSMRFWQSMLKERSWRRLDPNLWEFELAFGRVVDELKPDIIHANDFRMVGVGARAAVRARAAGRSVKLVYDAHELVSGIADRPLDARWLPAQIAYEKEYAPYADAVMTVSPMLADRLQKEHGLPERPAVVLNAPPRALPPATADAPTPDIRALCGIGPDTPLLVYDGGVNPTRGLDIMIRALPRLPDAHVALVVLHPTGRNPVDDLEAVAEQVGVTDRVHLLPYVPHWQVPDFLAPADAGVIPILHRPNHEIALITKFFEYSHARLPIVVSDVKTMADTVRETMQGEVYTAGDLDDYVRAVRAVLAEPKTYRSAYDKPGLLDGWTWETQAAVMDGIYARLLAQR